MNGLVHILGWGDFQMTQIDARNDPYPLFPKSDKHKVCNGDFVGLGMIFFSGEGLCL